MNLLSYVECMGTKPSQAEKMNIKVASVLYLEKLSTRSPWPTGEAKSIMIVECLGQANTHVTNSGTQVTEETSDIWDQVHYCFMLITSYLTHDAQIGHAGFNFCAGVKSLIVDHLRDYWPTAYSRENAKKKT